MYRSPVSSSLWTKLHELILISRLLLEPTAGVHSSTLVIVQLVD